MMRMRYFGILTLTALIVLSAAAAATAAGASDAYFEAEGCARALRKSPAAMKSRANWEKCIEQFQAVLKRDPRGPFAPASLFQTGMLALELGRMTRSEADRAAGIDALEQIQKRFPDSAYRERAAAELQKARAAAPPAKVSEPAPKAAAPPAKTEASPTRAAPAPGKTPPLPPSEKPAAAPKGFKEAEACFQKLQAARPTEKTRREWMLCIGRFHNVYLQAPDGPFAAQSLYLEGRLYIQLHRALKFSSDLRAARENFEKVVADYPSDATAEKAARELQAMPRPAVETAQAPRRPLRPILEPPAAGLPPPVPSVDPEAEPAADVRPAEPAGDGMALVQDLRFWSNPDYTRVVVYADRETDFSHRLLKRDPALDKPPRLFVDLGNSRLGGGPEQKSFPINDDLLSDARAAQYNKDTVRVVVDIKSFETYKVFSLKDPFRIVIDVWGTNSQAAAAVREAPESGAPTPLPDIAAPLPPPKGKKIGSGALAKQLALGVRRIVVDPGHGGKDFGAPGFLPGVHEKDVVLEISKRVAKKIREQLDLEAILTRSDDRYLTLEERTAFANTHKADLFVSIHTNASRDPRAAGIETYFLNLATDDDAIRVAAMENATSTKNISDLSSILNDLLKNAKINESSRMAAYVQHALVTTLNHRGYHQIRDKGVKQAPFYVLLGARMPSILVETSFISNPEECRRLTSAAYQDHLAESIVRGLKGYIREISPTAFSEPAPRSPG
jgi:N-acetylmuramoyl-L-alanine amidase